MGTLFVTLDQEQSPVSTSAFEYLPSQDGPSHRKLHTDLERGLRGLLEEVECGLHPEEGGHGVHPCYDHRGGRWNWTMITKTTVKSIELRFRLGEEFEETTTDGRKCKTTVTLEGNKMTTSQRATKSGEKDVTVVRNFDDGGITVSLTCEDVVCTQKYSRD